MLTRLITILMLVASGCSAPEGWTIDPGPYTVDQFLATADIVLSRAEEEFPGVREKVEAESLDIRVLPMDETFMLCRQAANTVGCRIPTQPTPMLVIGVQQDPCGAFTNFAHELEHQILRTLGKNSESSEHKYPYFAYYYSDSIPSTAPASIDELNAADVTEQICDFSE